MQSEIKYKKSIRSLLLQEFQEAPLEAWFDQATVAAVRGCSSATIERDRWAGTGVPFVKCGRSVRYTKQAILNWLEKHKPIQSTTQYQMGRIK
jgi:hypothetical protein